YVPTNNRLQLINTANNHLIVDAYNANPTSMEVALANFAAMPVSPKMAIIGEMRELGESSREEHIKLVDNLKSKGFDQVWLVGGEFEAIDCDFRKFADVSEVKAAIEVAQPQGYNILIKGSNGTKLFELPPML
ncbi:MAG: UDP-N-acetylmuramoyl-tripeptide--D-alanyl-D-alanine ligase, partial [Muribaculaceae bacterium]|nr:UDP-N-acetylmuramoyl-tripeptide--D-alanyl-D-alanine ligase [Muribaculaceae bacterium]